MVSVDVEHHVYLLTYLRQRPFPPVSLQRQVCLTVAAGVHVFSSGESLYVVIFLWLVVLLFLIDVNNVCL